MHGLLAKNQSWKKFGAMKAAELNTYPAISCQRGASAYYFDSINQQMNTLPFLVNQSKSKAFVSLPSSKKPQCKTG